MTRVTIKQLKPGMKVLKVVKNKLRQIVIEEGAILTIQTIEILKRLDISYLDVEFSTTEKNRREKRKSGKEDAIFSPMMDAIFSRYENDPIMQKLKNFALESIKKYLANG